MDIKLDKEKLRVKAKKNGRKGTKKERTIGSFMKKFDFSLKNIEFSFSEPLLKEAKNLQKSLQQQQSQEPPSETQKTSNKLSPEIINKQYGESSILYTLKFLSKEEYSSDFELTFNFKKTATNLSTSQTVTLLNKTETIAVKEHTHEELRVKEQFNSPEFATFNSTSLTKGYTTAAVVTGGVMLAGTFSLMCFNLGVGLLKFFMVIEVAGKFLYIPVFFNGALLNGLIGLAKLRDVLELNPFFIFGDDTTEEERFWGKMTNYGEFKNVFQSMPGITICLLLVNCLYMIAVLTKKFCCCKSGKSMDQIIKFLEGANLTLTEMTFVDIFFHCSYNLIKYNNSLTPNRFWGVLASAMILSICLVRYIKLAYRAYKNSPCLSDQEKEYLAEGYTESIFKKSKSASGCSLSTNDDINSDVVELVTKLKNSSSEISGNESS